MSGRLTQSEARRILAACDISARTDFHALQTSKVDALLAEADKRKYRKGRDASGSRARMFHAYVVRAAAYPRHDYGEAFPRRNGPRLG